MSLGRARLHTKNERKEAKSERQIGRRTPLSPRDTRERYQEFRDQGQRHKKSPKAHCTARGTARDPDQAHPSSAALAGKRRPDVARLSHRRSRRRTLWKAKSSCLSFSRCGSAPCRRNRNFIILRPPPPPPRDAPGPAGPEARGGACTEARDATDARPTHYVSVPAVPCRPLLARQWARTGPPGSPSSPGGPNYACAVVRGLLGLVVRRWVPTVGSWAVVWWKVVFHSRLSYMNILIMPGTILAPPGPTSPIFAVVIKFVWTVLTDHYFAYSPGMSPTPCFLSQLLMKNTLSRSQGWLCTTLILAIRRQAEAGRSL